MKWTELKNKAFGLNGRCGEEFHYPPVSANSAAVGKASTVSQAQPKTPELFEGGVDIPQSNFLHTLQQYLKAPKRLPDRFGIQAPIVRFSEEAPQNDRFFQPNPSLPAIHEGLDNFELKCPSVIRFRIFENIHFFFVACCPMPLARGGSHA